MKSDVVDEILEAVVERGVITRSELLTDWGLSLDQYAELLAVVRTRADVTPKRGRSGGIQASGPRAPAMQSETHGSPEEEQEEDGDEVLASVLAALESSRSLTRNELSELAGLNSGFEYRDFTSRLVEYAVARRRVIERKKGLGGIELKEGAQELYERLLASETGQLTVREIKDLSGLDHDGYRSLIDDIESFARKNDRRVRRIPGQGGIRIVRTAHEVINELLARKAMSKSEIIDFAGITSDEYPRFLEGVLVEAERNRVALVRVLGQRGGFEVREGGAANPTEDNAFVLEPWQQAAVEVLAELDANTLEGLVGSYLYNAVIRVSGSRSRRALATALVLRFGVDLLAERRIREALAAKRQFEPPGRWHAAGVSAQRFVEALGLPSRFAGERIEESPPDIQLLQGRLRLHDLADYQKSVRDQLLDRLGKPGMRALVSLPTGAGKTRVAVDTLRALLTREHDPHELRSAGGRGVVLWLAHTDELCEQACQCVIDVWNDSPEACPLGLVRFWSHYSNFSEKHQDVLARLDAPCVIVSTPQRLDNIRHKANLENVALSEEFIQRLRGALRLVLIDEAHRAAAPIYRRIAEHFLTDEPGLIGLTATPFRNVSSPETGAQELRDIFHELVEPRRIDDLQSPDSRQLRQALQERGVLAYPEFEEIVTNVNLGAVESEPKTLSEINAIDQRLAQRADRPERRDAVLKQLLPITRTPDASIIYFGPTVRDAEIMAYMLQHHGVSASVVSGNTREPARRQVIRDFKEGRIKVLCNCEVLTTGFDHPRITHVVVARPTMSQVLYEQMVGRGLRGPQFGGTRSCVILDCLDSFPGGQRPQLGFDRFRDAWGAT